MSGAGELLRDDPEIGQARVGAWPLEQIGITKHESSCWHGSIPAEAKLCTPVRAFRTVEEIAAATRLSKASTLVILRELEAAGLAEQVARSRGHLWRLTASAERRFGQVLRDLELWREEPEA